jgi:hypothetical protein
MRSNPGGRDLRNRRVLEGMLKQAGDLVLLDLVDTELHKPSEKRRHRKAGDEVLKLAPVRC